MGDLILVIISCYIYILYNILFFFLIDFIYTYVNISLLSGWVYFQLENLLLQLFILYILYQMTLTNNYYLLLYLFCFIVLLGVFLGVYQADFFTGFL